MAESTRRYNLRNTKKKPQGLLLKRWEVEYSQLISDEKRRIPFETVMSAIRGSFEDSGIEQWRTTLKCPLSGQRIRVPARYADCTHIECFDLEAFIRMKTQKNLRVCPICQKEIEKPLANLRIDKYMENVLSTLPDTMQVELMPDGSFAEVHEELITELNVIDDEEPYVQEVKQEDLDDDDECITLSDGEDELMVDISVFDMKPIYLMPLNADIKPNMAPSLVPEQIHFREDQEMEGIESPIPLVHSTVPTTIVKTEQIDDDPITDHLPSSAPNAVILIKREPPECVSSVPMGLCLQATLSSIDPTTVDSKPNIAASSGPEQTHSGKAQEVQQNDVDNRKMKEKSDLSVAKRVLQKYFRAIKRNNLNNACKHEDFNIDILEWIPNRRGPLTFRATTRNPALLRAMVGILDRTIPYAGTHLQYVKPNSSEMFYFISGISEKLVSCAILRLLNKDDKVFAVLFAIATDFPHQPRPGEKHFGWGWKLLKQVKKFAFNKGATIMAVCVDDNQLKWFRRQGFSEDNLEHTRTFYGMTDMVGAVFMECKLGDASHV